MPVGTALAQTHCTEYDVDHSLQSQNEENCTTVQTLFTVNKLIYTTTVYASDF